MSSELSALSEACDWSQPRELGRFTAHDPVSRGCDQSQAQGALSSDEVRSVEIRSDEMR